MKKISLTTQLMLALALGVTFGFFLQLFEPSYFRDDFLLNGVLHFVGTAFFNLVRMLITPLVLVSVITGVASLSDAKTFGKIGGKIVFIYMLTTAIGVVIALSLVSVFNPGHGLDMSGVVYLQPTINETQGILAVLLNIIPTNPFMALNTGNMLQILFFACLFGFSIVLMGDSAAPVKSFFESVNAVILRMVTLSMKLAPYGIFALLAQTFANLGLDAILALFGYIALVWVALFIHIIIVYGGIFAFIFRRNPNTGKRLSLAIFFKKMVAPMTFAFASSSSAATLPITMKAADSLGLSRKISSFAIPLGVTLNMDGTAIKQGIAVVFLATIYGVSLSFGDFVIIILTATLASIGTAGVPGAGIIMLSVVLTSVGLPVEAIAIVFGVDRILDMPRTTLNVTGDVLYTAVVAQQEGLLDYDQYDAVDEVKE